MPFGHKAGLPPSKKYLLMRQPHFYEHISGFPVYKKESETLHKSKLFSIKKNPPALSIPGDFS